MKKFLSILLSALVTVSLAAMVNAEDPAECPVLDTPNMELTANSGAGYATLEEAAASIGKTPLLVPTYVVGSNGNNNEGPDKLWDNDTATKFCTGEFPTQSIAKFANPVTVDGIIMATANDNSQYNNRSPFDCVQFMFLPTAKTGLLSLTVTTHFSKKQTSHTMLQLLHPLKTFPTFTSPLKAVSPGCSPDVRTRSDRFRSRRCCC